MWAHTVFFMLSLASLHTVGSFADENSKLSPDHGRENWKDGYDHLA